MIRMTIDEDDDDGENDDDDDDEKSDDDDDILFKVNSPTVILVHLPDHLFQLLAFFLSSLSSLSLL